MGALFEPLILFFVLFLSGSSGNSAEAVSVTWTGELHRILMFNIPALALILLFASRSQGFKWSKIKPGKSDLISAAFAGPGLLLISLTITLVSPYFQGLPPVPGISMPSGLLNRLLLFFSCVATGYLEETFFRFYLLNKFEQMNLGKTASILVSAMLFSVCHIYEGPWGVLNAALSGILLSFIFLHYRSLHGIALSHSLYNFIAYIIGG